MEGKAYAEVGTKLRGPWAPRTGFPAYLAPGHVPALYLSPRQPAPHGSQGTVHSTSRGTFGQSSKICWESGFMGLSSPPMFLTGLPTSALSSLGCQLGLEEHVRGDKVAGGQAFQAGGGSEAGLCSRWPI